MTEARKRLEDAGRSKEELDEKFAELLPVELEPGSEYLLQAFTELHASRQSGVNGYEPLSYVEIKAYDELTSANLTPGEIQVIFAVDRAFLAAVDEENRDAGDPGK